MKKLIYFCLAGMLIAACSKEDNNKEEDPAGTCGDGMVCFTLKGEQKSYPMQLDTSNGKLLFQHWDDSGSHSSVDLYFNDLSLSDYSFENAYIEPNHVEFYHRYRVKTDESNPGDYYYISGRLGGILKMTESNGKYSGTFSLTARNQMEPKDTIQITSGVFTNIMLK